MRYPAGVLVLLAAALAVGASEKKVVPRQKAERLFRARCSACHDPNRVSHRSSGRDGWREIVYRMQRMPQSGITPAEAETIIDYLAGRARTKRAAAPAGRLGGRTAYGKEWIAILEVAPVKDGKVVVGGRTFTVTRDGLEVMLKRGKRTRTVSLTAAGKGNATAVSDRWRVGEVTYELHLVLYELDGEKIRIGRALRRS